LKELPAASEKERAEEEASMATTKIERPPERPRHQVTGDDYPAEWARQIELYLDQEPRRLVFFGGLFGAFVLIVLATAIVRIFS
jgi:hypothetical protein